MLAFWRLSEADDLAIGRGDKDLAPGDGGQDVTGVTRP